MTAALSADIAPRLRKFMAENFLYMRPDFVLGDDDSLITSRILDSLGVMELTMFVEGEFGVTVDDADVTEANFGSISAITRYVERLSSASGFAPTAGAAAGL